MSEQHLNDAKLDATFEKMRRKAVAQAMGRDGFAEPDLAARDPTSVLQCGHANMLAGLPTGKQPQAVRARFQYARNMSSRRGDSIA